MLAALLCCMRTERLTPSVCTPCIRAALPLALTIAAVLMPACLNALKRGSRWVNCLSRFWITLVFLAVPTAKPTPSDFTF